MKQKIIKETSADEITNAINVALQYGWFVQSVTCNPETNYWIAILYKE